MQATSHTQHRTACTEKNSIRHTRTHLSRNFRHGLFDYVCMVHVGKVERNAERCPCWYIPTAVRAEQPCLPQNTHNAVWRAEGSNTRQTTSACSSRRLACSMAHTQHAEETLRGQAYSQVSEKPPNAHADTTTCRLHASKTQIRLPGAPTCYVAHCCAPLCHCTCIAQPHKGPSLT
jgi:hypothetical protein